MALTQLLCCHKHQLAASSRPGTLVFGNCCQIGWFGVYLLHSCAELLDSKGVFVWDLAVHGSDLADVSVDHSGGHGVKGWVSSYLYDSTDLIQMDIPSTSRKNSK